MLVKESSSFGRKHRILSPDLWLANSRDLNPVDYRSWGLMQEGVFKTQLRDTGDLKQHLIDTIGNHHKTSSTKHLVMNVTAKLHNF